MNILLTGASGKLGSFICAYAQRPEFSNINIIPHTRSSCDLTAKLVLDYLYRETTIDTIIHAAAYTNVARSNIDHRKVFEDNLVASMNVMNLGFRKAARLVYISTDFVFDGETGGYKTTDKINPQTVYAKSKASVELALSTYSNSLIVRTSFFGYTFPFDYACSDRFTSKDYLDIIGPKIFHAAISEEIGIIHVGTERKSFYDLALRRNSDIIGKNCASLSSNIGKDHSLDDLYQG